jgi:hypothetical protein
MPIGPSHFLFDIIIPALLALLVMCIAWQPWRRFPAVERGHWGGALAVGIAVLAAHPAVMSWPRFPPPDANNRLFPIELLALIVGLIDATIRPPRWISALLVFLVSAVALGFVLKFKLFGQWSAAPSVAFVLLCGLVGAIWWITFEVIADERGLVAPLSMWLVASTAAVMFVLTEGALWGKLTLSLAAAAGALFVIVLWRRTISLAHGAMHVFAILLVCLIIASHYLSGLTYGYLLTLLSAPLFIWIGYLLARFGPLSRLHPWQQAAIRMIVLAIPMAILLSVAIVEFRKSAGSSDEADPYGTARTSVSTSIAQRAI